MGKIAAVVLPANRKTELKSMCTRMGTLLCQAPEHAVECDVYEDKEAVCGLLRITPDAINRHTQPIATATHAGVACGYYLRSGSGDGQPAHSSDSAQCLIEDVAAAGVAALPRADGVYAFAHWDRRQEVLVAGVDKLGMRPLFWARLPGGGYAVASEVKAIVPFVDASDTNWEAWEEQLSFGFLFGNHTLFNGIRRLGAADVLTCRPHNHSVTAAENFLQEIDIVERPLRDFVDEQRELFDRAMRSLTNIIGPESDTILTLTGGFDSRRILGGLLKADRRPDVYTVPEVKFDGSEYESGIVRELCRHFGLTGYSVYPESAQEWEQVIATRDAAVDFESDEHRYSTIFASALSAGNKINFDGLAGDILFNGLFLRKDYFEADGDARFRDTWPSASMHRWLKLPKPDVPLRSRVESAFNQWGKHPNRFTYFYLMSRTRREVGLAPFSIQANVMESLCPYLDRDMVTSALSFSPAQKAEADLQRPLIQGLAPGLLDVPTTHDAGVASNSRYVRKTRDIETPAKLQRLRAMKLLSPQARWIPLVQKARFALIRSCNGFAPPELLKWELGKSERVLALTQFLQAIEQQQGYADSVKDLANVFGSKPHWVRSINDR